MICVRFTLADRHVHFRCQCNFAEFSHAHKYLLHVFGPWVESFSSTTILLIVFWCDTHRIPQAFFTLPKHAETVFHSQTVDHATGRVLYIHAKVELFCSWTFTAHCHWAAGANAVARQVWNMSGEARGYVMLALSPLPASAYEGAWANLTRISGSCRTTYKPELQINLVEQIWQELCISPNQKQSWRQPPTTSWGWLVKMQIPRTMPRP